MTKYNYKYYLYQPRKTDIHKTRCGNCGIWAKQEAIITISKPILKENPQVKGYYQIGQDICMECFYK